ncbi:MAG: leucyl aminopeptidase [Proteobacteria bacterium]|nr:leucyl aminopeptidase [Pseudomonadota bacterium]
MKIEFAGVGTSRSGSLAVSVSEGARLSATAKKVDKLTKGAITRALKASRFEGKKDQVEEILAPDGLAANRILLFGLGDPKELNEATLENIGGRLVDRANKTGDTTLSVAVDAEGSKVSVADACASIAFGARLGSYRFDRYRTTEKKDAKPSVRSLIVMSGDAKGAQRVFLPRNRVGDGVILTRDLVSEPGNVLYPETFAKQARQLAKLGLKIEVLEEKRLQQIGMRALLGVAQGSAKNARVVIMRWNGAPGSKEKPIAFVGKGVTFDSGGISIKPSAGMEEMKWDMGGAGTVVGLMAALAGRKARVNAIGAVGLVENMPSSTAQRPGDVVMALSGKSIEVINTDAEGRLVLADVLWYVQNRFKPSAMIDLATLTGAIIVALGHSYAGMFSNNDELSQRITSAGEATGERVWRMPMHESYEPDIKSAIADIKNVGAGRSAGSITAALFLQHFVNDVPWAHLDIAGMAWCYKASPTVPKGGSGYGVRLLDRLVADYYESGSRSKK